MIKLENGVKVPKLALGVWMIPEKETEVAVKSAIAMGYRLLILRKHMITKLALVPVSEIVEYLGKNYL